MSISARVIADSLSPADIRITTMVLRYPRFIHAEMQTHRMFSKNASSSRAIPVAKMLEEIEREPALPVFWGKNQAGMQAREELDGQALEDAKSVWLVARDLALTSVRRLNELGLHKQLANRILEPWGHIQVVCTATEWDNFYALRCHPDAQPEMKALADAMLTAHNASEPERLGYGDWHLPFVTKEECHHGSNTLLKFSVARCARVSFLNHEGKIDADKDMVLHGKLLESGHMSPFEHQARPMLNDDPNLWSGNFYGWRQYRKDLVNENRLNFPGLRQPT